MKFPLSSESLMKLPSVVLALLFLTVPICAQSLVASEAKITKVATGYRFTEGPAVDARGNVCFSDNHIEIAENYTPVGVNYEDPDTGGVLPDHIFLNDTGTFVTKNRWQHVWIGAVHEVEVTVADTGCNGSNQYFPGTGF